MLALDMDGTLLREDMTVSPANQAAVAQCLNEGATVVLATGRIYRSTLPYASLWPEHSLWVAASNGADVRPLGGERPLYQRLMPLNVAREIARWAVGAGLYLKTYMDDLLLVPRVTAETLRFSRLFRVPYVVAPDLAAAITAAPIKMVLLDDPQRIGELERQVIAWWGDGVAVTASTPDGIEIMAPGVSKGAALQRLADHLGLAAQNVAAVGNERNDLSMITWAGFGGVVANAPANVRAAAPRVVPHHEADGVAHFIAAWRTQCLGDGA